MQATLFPTAAAALWTVVSAGGAAGPLQGYNLSAVPRPAAAGTRYFDVWRGRELAGPSAAGVLSVGGQMDEYGAAAAVSAEVAASPAFGRFLAEMARLSLAPIASFSAVPVTSQNFTFETNLDAWDTHDGRRAPPPPPPRPAGSASISVPGTQHFDFRVQSLLGEPSLQPRYFGPSCAP